jgi:hypothetical protein
MPRRRLAHHVSLRRSRTAHRLERTQPIGATAWEQGEPGIVCRSAALPKGEIGEELAWFVRAREDRLRVATRSPFDTWF